MFFQIDLTPKEKKAPRSVPQKTVEIVDYNLLLAPFQPPTRIKLDTRIGNSTECHLTLQNTNDRILIVSISKAPPEERCLSFSDTKWTIDPRSDITLDISWRPREPGCWRDVLQLSDSRHVKYEISLILTCVDPHKKLQKRDGRPKKVITSKSNVSSLNNIRKKLPAHLKSKPQESKNTDTKITRPLVNKYADKENVSNNINCNWILEQAKNKNKKKEPNSVAPLNFSQFLNLSTFQFTPVKSSTNFEFKTPHDADALSSKHDIEKTKKTFLIKQESAITVESKVEVTKLRKETYVTVPRYLKLDDIQSTDDEGDEFNDSLSPKKPETKMRSEISNLFNDIKFTPFKSSTALNDKFLPNHCSTATKPKRTPEDVLDSQMNKNETFSVDDSKANTTYELSSSPTSAKNHLRPTCLAQSYDKNADIEFSSLHHTNNLCDNTRASNRFSKSQIDFGSAKDCLEADLWVKTRNNSLSPVSKNIMHSTLDSITEEDAQYLEDGHNENFVNVTVDRVKQLKPDKAVFIQISPPVYVKIKSPLKRISSAKKSKMMKEKCILEAVKSRKKLINESIKKNKSIEIPGVRISKLSLKELYKDKNKNVSKPIKKQPKEVSMKLHDPDDFLTMFCNPDPFAPTMTCDPFLANSFYYDDRWVFMQEVEFKKWLNVLLSPPEQLTTDIDSAVIDIGKLWQTCRAKEDVALAETKESVSARYHTNARLNALRKAAFAMYRNADMVNVLSKVTVAIEKEILIIRTDKDAHRDIGLQKIILELFLSYNPLWLRIGLEIIYGETIPLQSNNDIIGLTRFLLNRFFSDPFIVKQHSSQAHPTIRLKTFQAVMNKFILKKFLFLVYFLDYAKKNKLIGHDPCLFLKKAPFKDNREIIITFSRETLSGIGDVTKVLRNYNYVVSHKQSVLDEYDYAVENLGIDLRDGVRLCRVIELMTGKKNLTSQCRVPAISRLQKVHNVKVALATIKEAGYVITGSIDANSIADGHREKTLSLLWQLIYKFQAPRFEKAAKTIQSWWQSKLWYVKLKKMVRMRKHDAASVIQRAWRCRTAKEKLRLLKQEYAREMYRKNEAVRKIQLHWRSKKESEKQQKHYQRVRMSVMKIQRWWRRIRTTELYIKEFKKQRQIIIMLQNRWRARQIMKQRRNFFVQLKSNVITIQRRWRARYLGRKAREDYQNKRKAIIVAQRRWRAILLMKKDRQDFLQKLWAAKCIQDWRRRCVVAKRDRNNFIAMKNAVRTIEKAWKAKHTETDERKFFLAQRSSAIVIQKSWRNYQATKEDALSLKRKKQSCVKLQSWWRCVVAMRKYRKQRSSIIKIQRWYRSIILGRTERSRFLDLKNSAVLVQKNWRMILSRRDYKNKKNSVLKIETWYRNLVILRTTRNQYLQKKASVKKIEGWWLRLKNARHTRTNYIELRIAAIIIQQRWRAQIAMKESHQYFLQTRKSVIKVQSWWRMVVARGRFRKMKTAAKSIEIWRLRLIATREIRARYLKTKAAATVLQQRWRARIAMKENRDRYLQAKQSAVEIQSWWRMIAARNRYREIKSAVNTVVTWRLRSINAREVRARYLKTKAAATVLQQRWRARIAMKENRDRYLQEKQSAVKIQSWWRMIAASNRYKKIKIAAKIIETWRLRLIDAREIRTRYLKMKTAATVLQQRWRARIAMKDKRRQYLKIKRSVVNIQSWWRMIVARNNYREMKTAVKTIEIWRLRLKNAREIRARYLKMKVAAINVQRKWRAQIAMRDNRQYYLKVKQSTIKIQSWWRMILEKRRYKLLVERNNAAIVLQRRWRALKCGRQEREIFAKYRSSVLFVQRKWRAIVSARIERKKFLTTKRSSVVIQKNWKRLIAVRNYRKIKMAVLTIENWRKHYLNGKQVREDYLKLKMTVLRLQQYLRTKKQSREYKIQRNAVIKIQRFWRSTLKMRECKTIYQKQKAAAIVIQKRYRANRLALQIRNDYKRQVSATIAIQRWWKNILHQRRLKIMRRIQKTAVSVIEKWWLVVLEQRRIREMEKAELMRKHNAAVKLQAIWRGHKVRRAACKKMSQVRERAKNAYKTAVPSATLASRLQENIEIFKFASNIGQLSVCLSSLDVITRLSPNACINVCKLNLVSRLYSILDQANRSLPWLDICTKVISILLTLAKFKPTKSYVLNEEHIEVLVRLLNIAVDKKEDLFLLTATLIWVLTEDEQYAEFVKECSRTKYLLYTLYTSINKKLNKSTQSVLKCKNSMPSPKPDWGLNHKRPRTFTSIYQAITTISLRLNILHVYQPTSNDSRLSFNFTM